MISSLMHLKYLVVKHVLEYPRMGWGQRQVNQTPLALASPASALGTDPGLCVLCSQSRKDSPISTCTSVPPS